MEVFQGVVGILFLEFGCVEGLFGIIGDENMDFF